MGQAPKPAGPGVGEPKRRPGKPAPEPNAVAPAALTLDTLERRRLATRIRNGQEGRLTPIVPPQSIAARALLLVVAIMSLLACLTVGAVSLVRDAAADWQLDVAREVTIQIKPLEAVPIDPEIQKALALARATRGVREVRLVPDAESRALLEPWLGPALDMASLPVPRLILVTLADPNGADLRGLKTRLDAQVRGATLDDHSIWAARLRTMADTMVGIGLAVLLLVLIAMMLSVVFATRAAMAGNRDVIAVLHFVGADDVFIAREFQGHFLVLGFKGGLAGGVVAVIAFLLASVITRDGQPGADQMIALFGGLTVGPTGYGGVVVIVLVIAGLTALTSRLTVQSFLRALD
jgi:cell division transport system permease protein